MIKINIQFNNFDIQYRQSICTNKI